MSFIKSRKVIFICLCLSANCQGKVESRTATRSEPQAPKPKPTATFLDKSAVYDRYGTSVPISATDFNPFENEMIVYQLVSRYLDYQALKQKNSNLVFRGCTQLIEFPFSHLKIEDSFNKGAETFSFKRCWRISSGAMSLSVAMRFVGKSSCGWT